MFMKNLNFIRVAGAVVSSCKKFNPFLFPLFYNQVQQFNIRHLSTTYSNLNNSTLKNINFTTDTSVDMKTTEIVTEELLKIFILDKEDDDTYIANHLGDGTWLSKNVYGGALCAQSLVAAQKTVDLEYIPHSIHSFFILNVSPLQPVVYKIQRIRDGKSFCTRFITAYQNDKIVYSTQISFHKKEDAAISHQYSMPEVKPPEECETSWNLAKKYLAEAEAGKIELHPHVALGFNIKVDEQKKDLLEFRPVEPEEACSIIPHKSLRLCFWVKIRAKISDDREQHRALLAYISDATLATTANKCHVSHGYTPSMIVSLDNNCWLHTDDYRVDEWILYENESPIATNGRAFSLGRLWTRDGKLICSTTQESLSRTRVAKSSL